MKILAQESCVQIPQGQKALFIIQMDRFIETKPTFNDEQLKTAFLNAVWICNAAEKASSSKVISKNDEILEMLKLISITTKDALQRIKIEPDTGIEEELKLSQAEKMCIDLLHQLEAILDYVLVNKDSEAPSIEKVWMNLIRIIETIFHSVPVSQALNTFQISC